MLPPLPKAMKYTRLLALFALASAPAVFAIDPPPTEVMQFDHVQVDDAFAKGFPITLNSSFKVMTGHRVVPGVVEIHAHDTDVFYVTQGSATFVTGGTPVDTVEIKPGEFHAKEITGGTVRHLSKGDVIVIPSGIPHQFTQVDGTFLYFVVKITR